MSDKLKDEIKRVKVLIDAYENNGMPTEKERAYLKGLQFLEPKECTVGDLKQSLRGIPDDYQIYVHQENDAFSFELKHVHIVNNELIITVA